MRLPDVRDLPVDPPRTEEEVEEARQQEEWNYSQWVERMLSQDDNEETNNGTDQRTADS